MTTERSIAELRDLAINVLVAARTSAENAAVVADALLAAEIDELPSHGLSRLPFYADQSASGKVDGYAVPQVSFPAAAVVHVDGRGGFAFPAIAQALAAAPPVARSLGLAAVAIGNSHHCGVAGHHVEAFAECGLIALAFANTPAAIAPWGGTRPLLGTNPIAFSCPRPDAPPLVIDLSLSVAARGRIVAAADAGTPIPEGWALDADGRPTTDPKAALGGLMAPIGGPKGVALAIMVEVLAAAMTGSNFGFEAGSFFTAEGSPPRVGQLFIILDPRAFGGALMIERVGTLMATLQAEDGVRAPGDRRRASRARHAAGIMLPRALLETLQSRAGR